jgi:hypothetical protein
MGRSSPNGVFLALLCAATHILAGLGLSTVAAQTDVSSSAGLNGSLADGFAPQQSTFPPNWVGIDETYESSPMIPPSPALAPESTPGRYGMGTLDVIRESIFGAASSDQWHPLSLSTFFTEGWDEPFVKSPPGTNGAPKQNWFGAADGMFSRLAAVDFFYTNGLTNNEGLLLNPFPWAPVKPNTTGNEYWASCNLYLPLNQRLELLVVAPFIASNTTSQTGHYVANFGDLTISERFRLIERRNFSMQALLTERTPTGQTVNGNDINYITPALEFWWNFAPKWVFRGGTGINIDTGRTSATDTYMNNLAIGRYLTGKDAPIFKQLVAHVVVSTMTDVLGRKGHITEVYVSPGIRFGLDNDSKWFALFAIQIPVAAPQPYAFQPNFGIARNY